MREVLLKVVLFELGFEWVEEVIFVKISRGEYFEVKWK